MKKYLVILTLLAFSFGVKAQFTIPNGTVIGNQTVIGIPSTDATTLNAQALIYLPDDYNDPKNAKVQYRLKIFLHGIGEGSSNNITEVLNQGLPYEIAQGMKPYGIDSLTGDTVKYIVVSPHDASSNFSYQYFQCRWILPYIFSHYRADPKRYDFTGLSEGSYGDYHNVADPGGYFAPADSAYVKNMSAIYPISPANIETAATPYLFNALVKWNVGLFIVCGTSDGFIVAARSYDTAVRNRNPWFPNTLMEVSGGGHNSGVWNPPYTLSYTGYGGKNMYTHGLQFNKEVSQLTVKADSSHIRSINLDTLTGSAIAFTGNHIVNYAWSQISGPNTPTVTLSRANRTAALSGLTNGQYIYKLTATDDKSNTAFATDTVTVSLSGSTLKYTGDLGEYNSMILNNITHQAYGWNGTAFIWAGTPSYTVLISAGTHGASVVDTAGRVRNRGDDNSNGQMGINTTSLPARQDSMYLIATDSLGNDFRDIVQIINAGTFAGFAQAFLKKDGTVWMVGNTETGLVGNGTWGAHASTRPIQIPYPIKIKKIKMGGVLVALDTAGGVWVNGGGGTLAPFLCAQGTFSPDYSHPTKIALETGVKAVDIAGGGLWNYALMENHHLQGWGAYRGFLGVGDPHDSVYNHPGARTTAELLDTALNLPLPIWKIETNDVGTYVILTDSTLWAWGDNASGNLGIGSEIDWLHYTPPYNWTQAPGQYFFRKPQQVGKGIKFVNLVIKNALNFGAMVQDKDGNFYIMGRNKGAVLFNKIVSCDATGTQGAIYPNSWDVPLITKVPDPLVGSTVSVTSNYCISNPTATGCTIGSCTVPSNPNPTVSAGPTKNLSNGTVSTTISGLSTGAGTAKIIKRVWTVLSGPNTPTLTLPSGDTVVVSGLATGNYVLQLSAEDNYHRTNTSTMALNIGTTLIVTAGGPYTITLPTTSQAISVTVSGGTTPYTYLWTKTSGPGATTITSNTSQTATATGLQQGSYIFHCVVTDNNSNTSSADITVNVNSAVPPGTFNGLSFPRRAKYLFK